MTSHTALGALVAAALATMVACEPCAGTLVCTQSPEVSYSGQFIEFPTGKTVAGVRVAFARRHGARLPEDTLRAVSDGDGFFVLRGGSVPGGGAVVGTLIVTPPLPWTEYQVPDMRLETFRTRGDGGVLGRLMVNPYLQYIGELLDRHTKAPIANATIVVRAIGDTILSPPTLSSLTGSNGRFQWEPTVLTYGEQQVEIDVTAPGYPRTFHLRDSIALQFRDEAPRLAEILVGVGSYKAEVIRRGTKEHLSGVTVDFVRRSGMAVTPDSFRAIPNSEGRFDVPIVIDGPGEVIGDLIIHPPAPLPREVVPNVRIVGFDGDVRLLGPFGYGAAAIARPLLLYRATGAPVREGTHARFTRVGGLSNVTPMPWGALPDIGVRIVDTAGTVGYDVATVDTGVVVYDIEVRLSAPHDWETARGRSFAARFSDANAVDTIRVGRWFPWTGELRDALTDAPVTGATVEFRRLGGALVKPATFSVVSAANGTFPVRPEPLQRGTLAAELTVRGGATYRDTVVNVAIESHQDDVIRSLPAIHLTRKP